jgi:hypothetical protein
VSGADDLVVLPTLAVAVLPAAVLVGDDAVTAGEAVLDTAEKGQAIKEMTHLAAFSKRAMDDTNRLMRR